jgi:hypothetical protein
MTKREAFRSYSVAEAVVAAPWLPSVLAASSDNGNANLLQRINRSDELPQWPDRVDHFALEREAQRVRGEYVAMVARVTWKKLAEFVGALHRLRNRRTYVPGRKISSAFDAD